MHKRIAITLLSSLLFAFGAAQGQSPKSDDRQAIKGKPLGIGDSAPPLHVSKWFQGVQVGEFSPDKIYVVDFWTAWCSPCLVAMPHLSALQKEYRAKGVTIIGFTAKDERGNTEDKVASYLEKHGSKLDYSLAFADNRITYETWIAKAKRTIPCSFVIGKDGKIAYIGHSMYLDDVLPKIVAGTWSDKDVEALTKLEGEVQDLYRAIGGTNAEAGLDTLVEFQKKHPRIADLPYFAGPRVTLLIRNKKLPEARKAAEEAIAKAIENKDAVTLSILAGVLRSPEAKKDRELLSLSLKAAEAWVKSGGDKDMFALWNLAESYFALGDVEKAREYGAKAIAAGSAESDAVKKYIQQQIKRYGEGKER
jgi:thiol-disulfide isomerase/thioredoxin